MVTFSSVTSPVTSSMMNRSPVMVISRTVTSPVRMTTCFMGSMPAYSPDWVMVILSVFSAWEELSEDSSELPPLSVWELLSSEDEPEDRLLLSDPMELSCVGPAGCAVKFCTARARSTASTTAPPRIPPQIRAEPFHSRFAIRLPHFSARRQLLCSLCYHIPADCASGGYFQPFRSAGSVSPAGESSSTRSITNRGRCLTSM